MSKADTGKDKNNMIGRLWISVAQIAPITRIFPLSIKLSGAKMHPLTVSHAKKGTEKKTLIL